MRGAGGKKNPQKEKNLKITSLLSPFPTPMIAPSYPAPWKYPKDTLGRESGSGEGSLMRDMVFYPRKIKTSKELTITSD